MTCKIITTYVHPPIPYRGSDWCAYYDGAEEGGNYGWGATESEAMENFLEIMSEKEAEEDCAICGDWHEPQNIPLSCQTGDGE